MAVPDVLGLKPRSNLKPLYDRSRFFEGPVDPHTRITGCRFSIPAMLVSSPGGTCRIAAKARLLRFDTTSAANLMSNSHPFRSVWSKSPCSSVYGCSLWGLFMEATADKRLRSACDEPLRVPMI